MNEYTFLFRLAALALLAGLLWCGEPDLHSALVSRITCELAP